MRMLKFMVKNELFPPVNIPPHRTAPQYSRLDGR